MAGISDLYSGFCKAKVAKYFKSYRKTMNSLEKANPTADQQLSDWLDD